MGIKQTAEPEYAVIGKEREYLREGVEHEQYPQERASAFESPTRTGVSCRYGTEHSKGNSSDAEQERIFSQIRNGSSNSMAR